MTISLFIDTEWADQAGRKLVSLALVSQSGEEFYAERDILPATPTSFVSSVVSSVVYPLLERYETILDDFAFAVALRKFVARFDKPAIVYDYPNDLALFVKALNGFERFSDKTLDAAAARPSYEAALVTIADMRLTGCDDPREAYFKSYPSASKHHALHDARALRMACCE